MHWYGQFWMIYEINLITYVEEEGLLDLTGISWFLRWSQTVAGWWLKVQWTIFRELCCPSLSKPQTAVLHQSTPWCQLLSMSSPRTHSFPLSASPSTPSPSRRTRQWVRCWGLCTWALGRRAFSLQSQERRSTATSGGLSRWRGRQVSSVCSNR